MAGKRGAGGGGTEAYVPKYDANGKIKNWSSASEDGKLMKILVETGALSGKTPK